MSISYRIAGPVLALGLFAFGAILALLWIAVAALPQGATAERRALATAGHLAAAREAHRAATGLALAAHADGRDLPAETAEGLGRLVDRSAAVAVSEIGALRAAAAAAGQEPAARVERLLDELSAWRIDLARHMRDTHDTGAAMAAADAESAGDPAVALALRGIAIASLTDQVAGRLLQEADGMAERRRDEVLGAGALALGAIVLAALVLGGAGLGEGLRIARDLRRLPLGLQSFAANGPEAALPGEDRRDELGAMARALRSVASTMHELTRSRAEMERMALTDPLTGLPNRRGLIDFIARQEDASGWAARGTVAVMHIDLDHFKAVNDVNGHEAGDAVLREATRRMASVIRDSDILARVGGDEFVIFAQGLSSAASLDRLGERVLRQFDAPVQIGERRLPVTASIGAVLGGRRGAVHDAKRLLLNADIALSHAKAAGRARLAVFTSSMARTARARQARAVEIREGIATGAFEIWFQPVFQPLAGRALPGRSGPGDDTGQGRPAGLGAPVALELVARWNHPARGVLGPEDFLDAAEEHGLTEALLLPAVRQAFERVAGWHAACLTVPKLHLALSRSLLLTPGGAAPGLHRMLEETGLDSRRLIVAVAERDCSGRGADAVRAALRAVAALGAGTMIEGFGSIDAALGTVARIGATAVKIDLGRIDGLLPPDAMPLPVAGAARRIVTAAGPELVRVLPGLARLGESLGAQVIAGGVDDPAQLAMLRACGLAGLQGEAVAPAMDAASTAAWLARPTRPAVLLVGT